MEAVIIFSEEFHQSIEELVKILFFKEYFGFEYDCQSYGDRIYDFVENNIEYPTAKITPLKSRRFGQKYLKYKANHQTTWYIFFDQKQNQFIVNYILNNHSPEFSEFL